MKFITNLNGTILCPYQILLDISGQIPDSALRIANQAFMPICELNSTNDWINLESLGKPVAIRAKEICDTITAELKKQDITDFALDIYCEQSQLTSDNLFSLIYLTEAFPSIVLTFFTNAVNQSTLAFHASFLTKKNPVSIYIKTETTVSAMDNELLIDLQNKRQQIIKKPGFTFDDNVFNNEQIPEYIINQLIGYSWMCLKSGGYDIACHILEKTNNQANVTKAMQEQLFMHLLMIRFFSHQYALITNSEFPEEFQFLGQEEVKTLQFLKAYSATLSRNLTVANDFFKRCNISEHMQPGDETSLYQLNLFALSKVLQGETKTAFELEFRIKNYIEEYKIDIVGLKYVNFINIARLYKKVKDFDQSLAFYNKAYNEISGGGYTRCDHIYYNMNLGSLYESAENPELALLYWIKATMHWLASSNKYELSWRPRLILCNEKLSDVTKPLPIEDANIFLFKKLTQLFELCGINITGHSSGQYQFTDDTSSVKKEHCFIEKSLMLFTGHQILPLSDASPAEQKLSALVADYLQSSMDIPKNQNLFMIDTHMDTQVLQTPEEAIAFVYLANCKSCFFNGHWLNMEIVDPLRRVKTSLSKIIHELTPTNDGLVVTCKRSFLNKTLKDQDEIDLVNQLKQSKTTNLKLITNSSLNVIKQLAKKRIVSFSYSS